MADDNQNETPPETPGDLRARFEQQTRDLQAQLDAEKARSARVTAFATAVPGVDLTRPNVVAFLERYEGELTPEALTAAAADWNIAPTSVAPPPEAPPTAPPSNVNPLSPQEQAGLGAANDLAGQGTPPSDLGTKDPQQEGLDKFFEARRAGVEDERAAHEYIGTVMAAASRGDKRVIINPYDPDPRDVRTSSTT